MSTFVETAVESVRSHPSSISPSPEDYRALFERLERESELAREEARKQAHARAWELARQQGVKPIRSIEDLHGDFWPEEESVDEFLALVRAIRHQDKPEQRGE
jgi:glycerol-3-phosphate O-acyltransferase